MRYIPARTDSRLRAEQDVGLARHTLRPISTALLVADIDGSYRRGKKGPPGATEGGAYS